MSRSGYLAPFACALLLVIIFAFTFSERDVQEREDRRAFENKAEWVYHAAFPEDRTEVSATTDGEFVYVAGGFGPPEHEDQRATAPRTLWQYGVDNDSWEALTEIPEGVHHAPFQYHDGRLYILGGFRETSFNPVQNVRIYDIEADTWSEGAPMPTPRGAAGWTVREGMIHVIGGNAADEASVGDQPGVEVLGDRSTNVHEAYDPAEDEWVQLAPMITARNHLGVATAEGKIHAVLGRAEGEYMMTDHEIYDPETNSWEAAADVPTGRSGVATLAVDGFIYTFGGERLDDGNERTFDDAERYNIQTEEWEALEPMPTARHGLGAAVVNGQIHVISGGPGPAFTYGNAHEVLHVESSDRQP